MSYITGSRDEPLLDLTIGQLLAKAADNHEDDIFVVFSRENIRKSYRQVLQEVLYDNTFYCD